jgi:hypothetical protein
MSNTVKGAVQTVFQNKWGFYSIKVNEVFYGTGAKEDPGVTKGSVVEFEAEGVQKGDKTYYNVAKGTLKVVSAKSASSDGGSSSSADSTMSKDEWALKDKKTHRQWAQLRAIEYVTLLAANSALPFTDKTTPAKRQEIFDAYIRKYTDLFYSDVVDLGVEEADPSAPPSGDDMAGEE